MTGSTGAPERSTLFYVLNLYNVGFQDLRMGYACAMAWVLFLIILALTLAVTFTVVFLTRRDTVEGTSS